MSSGQGSLIPVLESDSEGPIASFKPPSSDPMMAQPQAIPSNATSPNGSAQRDGTTHDPMLIQQQSQLIPGFPAGKFNLLLEIQFGR